MKRWKYYFLSIAILSVLAVLFLGPSVSAQTPVPPTREQVVSEIKSYAQRHVESDTPMQTQFVVDLYRGNSVGLTPQEIALIYEEEYTLGFNQKNNDPWKQLRPNIGWVVAGVLLLIVALGDSVKKKIAEFFNSIWESIYKNLAGSRMLRRIAISHYKKALFEKNQELKIPFRPDHPLDMRTVFVPLQVAGLSAVSSIDVYQALSNHKRMMVIGVPGSGKSMLMKHIVLSYAEDRLVNIPETPIPVLLELHRFNDPKISVTDLIIDELSRNDFPKAENFVANNLKLGRMLLLFDGLDEVNSVERRRVIQTISDFLDRFDKCRSVITCRTVVYKGELDSILEKTFEIIEFSDQQIRRYLQSWESEMMFKGKSIEQLMLTLQARPRIMALARNPLMLTIITYLYTDTDFVLPQSRAEFYRKATDILLDIWHHEHNQYRASDKRQVLQELALFNQERGKGQEDRRSIDFQTVMAELKKILPQLNLNPEKDTRALLDEIVERSGLLLSIDGGEQYQFAHLTLQEYFSAAELKSDSNKLFEKFSADIDSWRETVKIWCGLDVDSTRIVQMVYDIDKITAFECLADAQKIDQGIAERIISDFEQQLESIELHDPIVRAFAAVASDARPRGAVVLKFLGDTLRADKDSSRRLAAIEALSLTNLPDAVDILIENYSDQEECRKALVRMGDLAAEKLTPLAASGLIKAMEDLQLIGTPRAAKALIPLLWGNNMQLALNAAWYLAGLLHRPNVEKVLNEIDISLSYQTIGTIDWIWKPFDPLQSLPISVISGRIAYLLSNMPMETELKTEKDLDPRLIVPIITVIVYDDLKLEEKFSKEDVDILEKIVADFPAASDNSLRGNIMQEYLGRFENDDFDSNARSLLWMWSYEGEKRAQESIKILDFIIERKSTPRFKSLLNGLLEDSKRKVLSVFKRYKKPTLSDWTNISNPIVYDLDRGWHIRAIWMLVGIFSIITASILILELFSIFKPLTIMGAILDTLCLLLILANWIYSWRPAVFQKIFNYSGTMSQPFESSGLLGIALGSLMFPAMLIYGLGYLLYLPILRTTKKYTKVKTSDFLNYIILMMILLIQGGMMSAIAYFITKNLLNLFAMHFVILIWSSVLLICAILVFRAIKLDRISKNPLRAVFIYDFGDSLYKSKLNLSFGWKGLGNKHTTKS